MGFGPGYRVFLPTRLVLADSTSAGLLVRQVLTVSEGASAVSAGVGATSWLVTGHDALITSHLRSLRLSWFLACHTESTHKVLIVAGRFVRNSSRVLGTLGMNASKFISKHQLSFRAVRVSERTDGLGDIFPTSGPMVNEDWARVENNHRRHFRVEFRSLASDFSLVTFFSQGSAHTEEPTAGEVLECLASDARSAAEAEDVLGFANEFGWELDSDESISRLRLVFAGCNETLEALGQLLGEDGREELFSVEFDETD